MTNLTDLIASHGWNSDMSAAPRDGKMIDLWCLWDGNEQGGVRLTDVYWREADPDAGYPRTGWCRMLDNGMPDYVELPPTSPLGLPVWTPYAWKLRDMSPFGQLNPDLIALVNSVVEVCIKEVSRIGVGAGYDLMKIRLETVKIPIPEKYDNMCKTGTR